MKKSDEMTDPASCLNKAAADEPLFVVRAKDPNGASTVRWWAENSGTLHPPEKISEALELADAMEDYRQRFYSEKP